jgi:hypothetical protein
MLQFHLFRLTGDRNSVREIGVVDLYDRVEFYFEDGLQFEGDAQSLQKFAEENDFTYEYKLVNLDFDRVDADVTTIINKYKNKR